MIYVLKLPDGALSIVAPVRPLRAYMPAALDDNGVEVTAAVPAETPAEYEASIVAGALASSPAGTAHVATVDRAVIVSLMTGNDFDLTNGVPGATRINARMHREGLKFDGTNVVVTKKRANRIKKLRAMRNRALAESDGEILRAQEIGDAVAISAYKSYRQELRDLPSQVTGITTMDDIRAMWPVKPA